MTTQPDLFHPDAVYTPPAIIDIEEARARRDRAIDQVEVNSTPSWRTHAYRAICMVADRQDEFTTDDVWLVLHEMGVESPREPRALGAVMRRASHDGVISATNKIEQSARPVCHAAPKRVWRSTVRDLDHGASFR